MDTTRSVLESNPSLPEFSLPMKEERYLQNRNVQLRARYRKREDRFLSLHPDNIDLIWSTRCFPSAPSFTMI